MLIHLTRRIPAWSRAAGFSLSALVGCGGVSPDAESFLPEETSAPFGQIRQHFVNGSDDRREYFELSVPSQQAAMEQFTVALMARTTADKLIGGDVGALSTWRQLNHLCDGEPFGEQPVAAFCSGVLVDYDLVLTSGHCVNLPIALSDVRVAFDYFYRDSGELALAAEDVYEIERMVVAQRDPETTENASERLDFAWLELKEPARAPHLPAPSYAQRRGANPNDPVISIGAGGGVPIKWDDGGHVQDIRSDYDDYFIADTDTSQGSSGGGIFDANLALLGNLARGAPDFELTDSGCRVTSRESDPAAAREQFTYVHRAVAALCASGSDSALCDPECGEPCDPSRFAPLANEEAGGESGCSFAVSPPRSPRPVALLLLALAVIGARRSQRSLPVEHRAVAAARDG